MKELLDHLGYKECTNTHPLKRSNPDINDKTYVNPCTNKEMVFEYRSEKPNSISDIYDGNIPGSEHPYEQMAYDIANAYHQEYLRDVIKFL